uniref:Cofilin/tropomyosin-type actin-binding protein n=1 Tax=Coptotermes formosanus TaxID=36987 RepID=R4UMR8_COPFO|nr:cofilin/tropomyosin-type actin-binding protein [Coptotermes formosanus]
MDIGIKVSDEVVQLWNELKIGKKYRWVIFTFSANLKEIIVEKKGEKDASYSSFLDELPPKDVRYAIYDYDFPMEDGTVRNKIVFVIWAPDVAPARRKMIITGSKVSLKNALPGVSVELQANDDADISEENMKTRCMKDVK